VRDLLTWIIFPSDMDQEADNQNPAALIGGKAASLLALQEADLPIPAWFAVTPEAFEASVPDTAGVSDEALKNLSPSPDVNKSIAEAVARLCAEASSRFAVRSSAVDEDGAQHSFAGQLESFLFVRPENVAVRVADVWRSGFTERILTYRRERGMTGLPQPPAVLVQRMVDADSAGVAFSADPTSGRRDRCIVAAVYGLGTALVGGDADADTFDVDLTGDIVDRQIAVKHIAHRFSDTDPSGTAAVPIAEDIAAAQAVDNATVIRVADLARRSAAHFGRAQDIEWAVSGSELFLLQSRPITTLGSLADPSGERRIWDNSNIAESYGGVTTPLTFSFALNAYGQVYREFCRILGVDEDVIAANGNTFDNMLGLIRGRIYYNLLNWYRVLAMLPGFQTNRKFMEQMMGVKEELSPEAIGLTSATTANEKWRDRYRILRSIAGLIASHRRLPADIVRFHSRLESTLSDGTADRLGTMRLDELTAHYRDLERKLLRHWDAPLVNDFFAMIYYGVLARLCKNWCGDEAGSLQNDLLCGQGGMISAEPAKRVQEMAKTAAGDAELVEALCNAPLHELRKQIAKRAAFNELYQSYLDKFGDRCLSELKLESPTLHDDPLLLLRSVGQLAEGTKNAPATAGSPPQPSPKEREADLGMISDAFSKSESPSPPGRGWGGEPPNTVQSIMPFPGRQPGFPETNAEAMRAAAPAEARVAHALAGKALRRRVFAWVLDHARERLRNRENLRFERTRVFGRVRRVFMEIGKRLTEIDSLDTPRDVFYLRVDEVLGYVEGTSTAVDLKRMVAARKPEFEAYTAGPAPADRFETFGAVYAGNAFTETRRSDAASPDEDGGDTRRGIACCPGIVQARVRIVIDPRSAALRPGEILVAERTDPGWIMLFAAAGGLLVERGSLLSHSAIVSREMGIPSIVSLSGITTWLHDGDLVELNGATGVVKRLEANAE